jgi:pyridinium-3,5-bisthiocarboxylic acid mononucleotide nickel chelatase
MAEREPSLDTRTPGEPRRIAWFNCQAGVAGDMTMAALVDAGADRDEIAHTLGGLGIDDYALHFERVQRCGVGATWANVVTHRDTHDGPHTHRDTHDGHERHVPHRPVAQIYELLDHADLAERVRHRARLVFERLAAVEGAIHGIDPDDVELHEVGALDAIVDVVGVCAALESLGIDDVWCSPVAVGTGSIRSAHGTLPNPAPATVALLRDAGAPTVGLAATLEVTTPTGAALMTALATGFGPLPAVTITAVGYGAGTADVADRANVVQVVVGTATDETTGDGTPVALLETNVDDASGEVLADAITQLLAAGAHDAWLTPIVMKKGRPAHVVNVLCDPAAVERLRSLIVELTGTFGARSTSMRRWPQRRTMSTVVVEGHTIGVKIAAHRVKVEFDDARAAARALGRPVRDVIAAAEHAASHITEM